MVVIAGLEIPSTVFNANLDKAIKTPVFPADTTAAELPSRTSLIAIYIDVSWA